MTEGKNTKEVDVLAIVVKIFKEKKSLLLFTGTAAIVGVIVALSTPKYYTSTVILAPEVSAGASISGSLSDLASNFGLDLGKKTSIDAIYPELYPEVFTSTDFLLGMFDVPVRLMDDDRPRSYIDHLKHDVKIPFWDYPIIWMTELRKRFEKKDTQVGRGGKIPYTISRNEDEFCKIISKSIICLVDKKTSVITISATDNDPMVAAILADTVQHRLQAYITDYRTKKSRIDYDYYKKLMIEAKERYLKSQQVYANFSDANNDVVLQSVNAKIDQLENDMQLQYNAYNQLVVQTKAAEAKVQERTPAFTIIQAPYITHKASSRPRLVTVLMFIFLGGVLDVVWILKGRELYQKRKKN